jgi:hypothetical protein
MADLEKQIGGDDGTVSEDEFLKWYKRDKQERSQLEEEGGDEEENGDGDDAAEKEDDD